MKTRYIIAAASALLLLAGCTMEKDTFTAKSKSSGLRAVIEQDTRVSFDATGKFGWDEGDQIAVYVGSAFETVTVEYQTGEFKVEGSGDRSFYAVYPASAAPADNSALTVTIPDSYDISSVTDDDFSPVPMVAQNIQGQDELYFLHVGGLVRIICKDLPAAVNTAVVSFDKDVHGTYAVNTSNPSNPTITTAGDASNNTVTFTVGGKKDFVLNVPVPCGTYTNVSLALDGATAQKLNESDLTFARHHGKTLVIGELTFTYELEGLHDVLAEYLGGTKELSQAFSSYKTDGTDKVGVPFTFEFSETGEDGTWTDSAPDWFHVADGVDYTGSTAGEPLQLVITPQANTAVDYHAIELSERPEKTDFDLSTVNVATGETVGQTTANCYVVDAPGSYKFPVVYGNALKDGVPNETAWHATKGVGGEFRTSDYVAGTFNELVEPFTASRGLIAYMVDHRDRPITTPYIMKQLADAGDNVSDYKAEIVWMDVLYKNSGSGLLNGRRLVQNVAVSGTGEDAYITFDVPAESIEQGNVLIALKADGVVVWSWHIWVTDRDLKAVDGPNDYKFAPVNIGWRDTRETTRYDERTWYIRVVQTEDGGIASDPLQVLSRAGEITIDSGGRSMVYQAGRKEPRAGTFLRTKGLGEPTPTGSSLYVGYGVPSSGAGSYVTGQGSVPELKKGNGNTWILEGYGEQDGYVDWDDPRTIQKESISLGAPLTIGLSIRYPRVSFGITRVHGWINRAWHNLWDSSENATGTSTTGTVASTKTIYDPSPSGYKVPSSAVLAGFTSDNTSFDSVDGVPGRSYSADLFLPFIPSTGSKTQLGRYGTCRFSATTSRTLLDIYPDYVYGLTSEAYSGNYVIRSVQE